MGSAEEMHYMGDTLGAADGNSQYYPNENYSYVHDGGGVVAAGSSQNGTEVDTQRSNKKSRSEKKRAEKPKPKHALPPVENLTLENPSPKGSSSWNFTACSVGEYISSVSREIAFSLWFRCYVFYLLFCNLTFIIAMGTNMLLAASYRMVIPSTEKGIAFFSPLSMLCLFWSTLILLSALIFMSVRLTMHWIGFSRHSVNVLLLPNWGSSEAKCLRYRDYQLFLFILIVLIGPLASAVVMTVSNGEPFFSVVPNFTFSSFICFECLIFVILLYFWWITFRQKARALRMGSQLKKAAKALDSAHYSYESPPNEEGGDDAEVRERPTQSIRDPATAWHRKKITNPLVMAEFGADLYSFQAYFAHVLLGITWVFVTAHPVLSGTSDYLWMVISVVVLMGSIILIWQGPHNKSAKKVAKRQRVASIVIFVVWGLFIVTSIGGAAGTEKGTLALELAVILLLTQGLALRRHDHHVREEHEATMMVLPLSDTYEQMDEYRRRKLGRPSKCLPLIPCSSLWQGCCSTMKCVEPRQLPLDFDNTIQDITRSHDTVMRPIESLGYSVPGEATASVNSTIPASSKPPRESFYNRRDRVLTADAMIMTWYFILFIIFIGMTYGFGDWSTFGLAEPVALTGSPYSGTANYMICDMRWGAARDLTIQDFGLLVMASHQKDDGSEPRDTAIAAEVDTWFNGTIKFTESFEAARIRLGLDVSPAGSPVLYDKYTTSGGSEIFVFRDPEFGRSWMRDVDLLSDAAFFDVLSFVNPFFSSWSFSQKKSFVKFTNFLKKPLKGTSENEFALEQVKLAPGKVYLTGAGTHGAWASIIGSGLEGTKEYSVVSFGPPGNRLAQEKYVSASLTSSSVSVLPENAFLTTFDSHVGFTEKVNCDSSMSSVKCQNFKNTLCEVLKGCGDSGGRYFKGFEPGVAGFTCDLID